MAHAELLEHTYDTLYRALNAVGGGGGQRFSEEAHSLIDRIKYDDLGVLVYDSGSYPSTPTSFMAYESPNESEPVLQGALVLNIDKILSSKKFNLQADVVRTMAVAYMFPHNGFEKRRRDTYVEALETQRMWLKQTNGPTILNDPRNTDPEQTIKALLGEEYYYTDTGFGDWQRVINSYMNLEISVLEKIAYSLMWRDSDQFMVARERFSPVLYRHAAYYLGADYREFTVDERAERAATALFAMSL